MIKLPKWLLLSIATPVLWGLWGALTEIPEKWLNPAFPPTLGYVVWSLTMLPVTVIAMSKIGWRMTLTWRSFLYGCAVGFSGAAGQLILFWVLKQGPAYLIFPIVCLSPAVTIVLSWTILRERTYPLALSGICCRCPRFFSSRCSRRPEARSMAVSGWWGPSRFFSCGVCRPTS